MSSSGKTILIVEDDKDILSTLSSILESEGYRIEGAENGKEALEVLKKDEFPNLIMLDMKMPVMDGWHFAAEYNALYGHRAPVVVMTAAPDAKKRASEVNAEGWIGKPFKLEELLSTVEKYAK
jgi:CheY-like chemotaxis protein